MDSGFAQTPPPYRQVRAVYTEKTIRVYQAFGESIARRAIEAQRFVPPFKMDRMTWIKPSFLWIMYRSGWATKRRQEKILAIDITREGFEWALSHASLSHFTERAHASHEEWEKQKAESPVRVQWDPERNIFSEPLPYRSIQIGLSGEAVQRYVNEWITSIQPMNPLIEKIRPLLEERDFENIQKLLPEESIYPLPEEICKWLGV